MRKHSNVFLDLLSSTFYTVIGYVCLDVVFAISLHYISLNGNSVNDVAGVGLAYTTVNVLLIPMALGNFFIIIKRNKLIIECSYSISLRSLEEKTSIKIYYNDCISAFIILYTVFR